MLENLVYKVANSAEREEALNVRRSIFAKDLGHVPDDGLDHAANHLIARDNGGEIVAAFRILGMALRPFDFEKAYSLDPLVEQGRRPSMIGRLWVRPEYRGVRKSIMVHQGLLRLAMRIAREQQITDYFLITYPKLIKFYRAAMFRDTGVLHDHPGWGTVHVMHLDVLRTITSSGPESHGSGLS